MLWLPIELLQQVFDVRPILGHRVQQSSQSANFGLFQDQLPVAAFTPNVEYPRDHLSVISTSSVTIEVRVDRRVVFIEPVLRLQLHAHNRCEVLDNLLRYV